MKSIQNNEVVALDIIPDKVAVNKLIISLTNKNIEVIMILKILTKFDES